MALILALVMCLSLCACGSIPGQYVGQWGNAEGAGDFVLLTSGRALVYCNGLDYCAENEHSAISGTWEVEGDYLIIHYERMFEGGTRLEADVYKIIDSNTMTKGVYTYGRK